MAVGRSLPSSQDGCGWKAYCTRIAGWALMTASSPCRHISPDYLTLPKQTRFSGFTQPDLGQWIQYTFRPDTWHLSGPGDQVQLWIACSDNIPHVGCLENWIFSNT